MQDRVHGAVAAEVQPVSSRGSITLPGRQGDGGGSAPTGELSLAGEPAGIADLDQQIHGGDDADALDAGQRAAEPLEKGRDLPVELLDAGREGGDVGEAGDEPVDPDLIGGAQAVKVDAAIRQRLELGQHTAGTGSVARTARG